MKCRECPDYAKCSKESNLTIKRKNCSKAKTEKVKTNADRIRAMSDEELAETLVRYDGVYDVYRTDGEGVHYDWDAAVNEELEWLKQPAE